SGPSGAALSSTPSSSPAGSSPGPSPTSPSVEGEGRESGRGISQPGQRRMGPPRRAGGTPGGCGGAFTPQPTSRRSRTSARRTTASVDDAEVGTDGLGGLRIHLGAVDPKPVQAGQREEHPVAERGDEAVGRDVVDDGVELDAQGPLASGRGADRVDLRVDDGEVGVESVEDLVAQTGAEVGDVGDRAEDLAEEDQVDPIIPIEREIVDGLVAALAAEEAVELRAFPVALLREGSLSGLRIRAAREIAEARRGIARGE